MMYWWTAHMVRSKQPAVSAQHLIYSYKSESVLIHSLFVIAREKVVYCLVYTTKNII